MYDITIIGSGPAGVSAALYAARGGMSVLIISKGIGELAKAEKIDNYYGFSTISGTELHHIGVNQAKALGAVYIEGEVTAIGGFQPFEVEAEGQKYQTKAVIIATGRPRKKSKIPGISTFEGRGVSYCAVCDGFFFKGKEVGVIGSGAFALSEAAYLAGVTAKVTIFTGGEELLGDIPANVEVCTEKILSIVGENTVTGIELESQTVLLSGVFVALGTASGADFAATMGIELENGSIKVDKTGATNVPGIFAAGDAIGGFLQISVAAGEGAMAGSSAVKYARKLK